MKASRLATAITAAAACAAVGLIVASCSNSSGSPVAPGASSNLAAHTEVTPEPTPDATPTPTPTPTPETACTPGYYKTHAINNPGNQCNVWYGASFGYCDGATGHSCSALLDALRNHPGAQANAAAAYLNSVSGCTEPTGLPCGS